MDILKTISMEEISSPTILTKNILMEDKIMISSTQRTEDEQSSEDGFWIVSNLVRLDDLIISQQDKNIYEFTEQLLSVLSTTLKSVRSAFFVYFEEENKLRATACFASSIDSLTKKEFNLGEGLIGEAAKSGTILLLDEIEIQFDTALGGLGKASMLIVPLSFRQKTFGVVEIMITNKVSSKIMTYLERVSKSIAMGMENHFASQKSQKTLLQDQLKQQVYQFLEVQLNEKDSEIADLQAKLDKKEAELEEALSHINLQEILPQPNNQSEISNNNLTENINQDLMKKQTEIDMLKDAVRWKDEEIDKLDNEILERKTEYRSKIETFSDEITQLKAQLEGQNITTQNEQLLEAWKERYVNLENDLDQTRQELSKLRQLLQEADENYHQTKGELVQVQAKYKKREDEYIVSQYLLTQQEDTTELNRRIDQLNYIIADKESEIIDLKEQLGELDTLNVILQEKDDLKNYIDNLEEVLAEKDKATNNLIEKFETQLKNTEKNYLEDINVFKDEILILKNNLNQKNNDSNQDLQNDLDNKNKEILHLRDQVAVLVQSVSNKEKLLEEQTNQLHFKISTLEKNLIDIENDNAEIKKTEEHSKKRIQSLEQDIFYKNNALQAMAKLEIKLTSLEEELYNKTKEANFLQENIKDLNEKSENVPELAELIAELRLKDEELTLIKEQKNNDEAEFQKRLEDLELIHFHLSEKKKEIETQAEWLQAEMTKIIDNQSLFVNNIEKSEQKTENSTQKTENSTKNNNENQLSSIEKQKIKALDNSFISMELDMKGNILTINKPFERTLGYDLNDINNKNLNDIVDIADRSQSAYQQLFSQIEHKIIVMLNLNYEGKEGELVRLRTFFNPIENENKEVEKILAISHYA
ncbi:MAG: PAS domain-containing protein [Cytophagia bacterium]|nr:MAG: PAS domain-containing protein [Cytophagia bacterium]TAG42765.1 MAG: PAS domain-containing protein [Cytophagia bacterium]